MKAIVNTSPHTLTWSDWPVPEPGSGQVRIRSEACGICATDIQMIAGWERTGFPAIPGHEWSGTVDAAGAGVDQGLVGQPCVAENVLSDGGEVGFEHPGGYGQYLLTEARNVIPLPTGFPLATAALIEPLAVMVRGLRRLRLEDRRNALVLGDGPIGLLAVMLLRHFGVEDIWLAGGREPRLVLGRSLGANDLVDYHSTGGDLAKAILRRHGRPFTQIIEASGSASALAAALEMAAPDGKILVAGDYGDGRAAFRWNHLLHRELQIIGSNASAGAWPEAVNLAVKAELPLHRLISHRFPAQEFQRGYELTQARDASVVKVVLEWQSGGN